jgi:hypothetical protein
MVLPVAAGAGAVATCYQAYADEFPSSEQPRHRAALKAKLLG